VWERLEGYELRWRVRGMAGLRPGQRPEPSLPAGIDRLPQIEHIVVLIMENHSYDNYFGMLQGRGEGFPLGADGGPAASNPGADGEPVRAHHLPSTIQYLQAPSQSWHASHLCVPRIASTALTGRVARLTLRP
jgi:phospholipase C